MTLHFVVLSFDRYSRDDVIGEVMLDLEALDLSNSDNNPLPISREITPRSYKVTPIPLISITFTLTGEYLALKGQPNSTNFFFYS